MTMMSGALCILMLTVPQLSSEDRSTGFWIQESPRDTPDIQGQVAKSHAELEKVLKTCKWNEKQFPKINWSTDYAVVISPSKFDEAGDLKFYGLQVMRSPSRGKPMARLTFGWKKIPRKDTREVLPGGIEVITSGSSRPGARATLVVSFPRSIHEECELRIHNRGLGEK